MGASPRRCLLASASEPARVGSGSARNECVRRPTGGRGNQPRVTAASRSSPSKAARTGTARAISFGPGARRPVSLSVDPRIGSELFGYRLEALLGRGGMGVVYKAYDPRLKRYVALKLIAPELSGDARFRERFLAESELAASLEHPNVVPIYDAFEADGRLAIAMRYVEGTELKQLLQTERVSTRNARSRSAARWPPRSTPRTPAGWSTATSSPRTCSSTRTSTSTWPTSASAGVLPTPGVPGEEGLSVGTPAYVSPEQIEGGDGRRQRRPVRARLPALRVPDRARRRSARLRAGRPLGARAGGAAEGERAQPRPADRDRRRHRQGDGEGPGRPLRELRRAGRGRARGARPAPARRRSATARRSILTAVGVALAAAAVVAGVLLSQGGGPGRPSTKPTLTPKVDSLQRIDPKTNKLVATIGGVGSNPSAIAVGAGSVWVGSQDDGTVSRVDPKTNEVRSAVNTGAPDAIVIRDGSVLVANQFGPSDLDRPGEHERQHVSSTGFGYGSLATGRGAHSGRYGSSRGLDRINPAVDVVTTLTDVGLDPFALAAGEGAVWVLDDVLRSVFRVDPATNSVAGRSGCGFDPGGIAVGGGSVWVTNPSGGSVDPDRPAVEPDRRVDPGGTRPGRDRRRRRSPSGSANYEDGTVSRIDPRNGSVVATIPVGRYPATARDRRGRSLGRRQSGLERRGELVPALLEVVRLSRPGVPARDPAGATRERSAVPRRAPCGRRCRQTGPCSSWRPACPRASRRTRRRHERAGGSLDRVKIAEPQHHRAGDSRSATS